MVFNVKTFIALFWKYNICFVKILHFKNVHQLLTLRFYSYFNSNSCYLLAGFHGSKDLDLNGAIRTFIKDRNSSKDIAMEDPLSVQSITSGVFQITLSFFPAKCFLQVHNSYALIWKECFQTLSSHLNRHMCLKKKVLNTLWYSRIKLTSCRAFAIPNSHIPNAHIYDYCMTWTSFL